MKHAYCIMVSRQHPDGLTYHPMVRWIGNDASGHPWTWTHLGETWEYVAWDLATAKLAMSRWGITEYTIVEQEPEHFPMAAPIHGRKPVVQQVAMI